MNAFNTIAALALSAAAALPMAAGRASAAGDVEDFGLTWVEIGNRPGDCRVLADEKKKPLVNPYYPTVYATGRPGGCPDKLKGDIEVGRYSKYAIRDNAIRFYAPWGRTYVFRHNAYLEGWGYGQKYRFEWIAADES